MNSQQIQNIYTANGPNSFNLNCHDDLIKLHSINIKDIQGYNKLSQSHKAIFDTFIINFYNAQGLETRATLLPKSINHVLSEQALEITITAIHADGNETKLLKKWKDKKYKNISCIHIEKETYLRFEYQVNGHNEWLHVLSDTQWY